MSQPEVPETLSSFSFPTSHFATHASRNPLKSVIEPRNPIASKKTRAEKRTSQVAKEVSQSRRTEFEDDVLSLKALIDEKITEISQQHAQRVDYIRTLIYQQANYKTRRAPNRKNALLHHKSVELNSGMSRQTHLPG